MSSLGSYFKITFVPGTDYRKSFFVQDAAGHPIDYSGAVATMTVTRGSSLLFEIKSSALSNADGDITLVTGSFEMHITGERTKQMTDIGYEYAVNVLYGNGDDLPLLYGEAVRR